MVKFDIGLMRFLEDEDYRALTALEMAHRNHEIAPTVLVERIAQLPHGGCRKRLNTMLKHKIIHHESKAYDGFSLKYPAYDILALRTFSKRGTVLGVGARIGCGKESDIFLCEDANHTDCVLKLQRLGRCSFRTVAKNRDYKNGKERRGESWFYLSRLAATKEYAFMRMLYDEGFPVPKPIDHNRHAIVMEHVQGTLLNNITTMDEVNAQKVYERALHLIVRLAQHGLIHGDFNEFNMFVTDDFHIVMIDFPQMVSTDHKNAGMYFDRDCNNVTNFFRRRFKVHTLLYPKLECDVERVASLDKKVAASGFSRKDQQELEDAMEENGEVEEDEEEEDEEADDEEGAEGDDGEDSQAGVAAAASAEPSGAVKPATTSERKPEARNAKSVNFAKAQDAAETAESEESEEETDEEEEEEEEEEDDTSVAENIREQRLARNRLNPNLTPTGEINTAYIRNRVKQHAQVTDERNFRQNMHRNRMKGKEKQKIGTQLRAARNAAVDDW